MIHQHKQLVKIKAFKHFAVSLITFMTVLESNALSSGSKRFLQNSENQPLLFSPNMPCYPCIMNGWTFCVNAKDHSFINQDDISPDQVCCENRSKCPQTMMQDWSCSSQYGDQFYSLRVCPFMTSVCGAQSEMLFKSVGSSLDLSMTFYPSQMCFYTIRSQCGAPAFQPQGEAIDNLDIYTIEYDDGDVQVQNITIKEGTSDVKFPIPAKSEKFMGNSATSNKTIASQLIDTVLNPNGSITYYYSNGSYWIYNAPRVVTYLDDQVKDYSIFYPNGTNITYNLDGSYQIDAISKTGVVTSVYYPAATRLLQIDEDVKYGTMYFFMDGRIKDVVGIGVGGVYWNYKFYSPKQNPNRINASGVNNTWHMKVQYASNGSFFIYYPNGNMVSYTSYSDNWKDYYNANVATLALPEFDVQTTTKGKLITFVNDTQRLIYTEPDPEDRINLAIAPLYDDIYSNQTIRYYRNGTVCLFSRNDWGEETFIKNIVSPKAQFQEADYHLFTQQDAAWGNGQAGWVGGYWVQYINKTEKFFYPQPAIDWSRYKNATSVQYEEYFYNRSSFYRVVFNNGTKALCNYTNNYQGVPYTYSSADGDGGNYRYARPYGAGEMIEFGEVQRLKKLEKVPTSLVKEYIQYNKTDGSFSRVYDEAFDQAQQTWRLKIQNWTKPLNSYNTAEQNATSLIYNETSTTCPQDPQNSEFNQLRMYANGSSACYKPDDNVTENDQWLTFVNGLDTWTDFQTFETVTLDDGTRVDKYYTNDTWFFFPPPPADTATSFQKATALWYKIQFHNMTTKRYYLNGTIAWFNSAGRFSSYVVAPSYQLLDYPTQVYGDGSWFVDYTITNNTKRFWQSAPLLQDTDTRAKNTSYEIACALYFTDFYDNGTIRSVYRNGTIAIFLNNGFVTTFDHYEVEPKSIFVWCVDDDNNYLLLYEGGWWSNCTNGTNIQYGPSIDYYSSDFGKATAYIWDMYFPNNTFRRDFRNGSVALYKNAAGIWLFSKWITAPKSIYTQCFDITFDSISYWKNCTDGNSTLHFVNTTLPVPNTAIQRINYYTGQQKDQYFTSSTGSFWLRRFYRNGTVASFSFNGNFYSFVKFEVAPTSLYVDCQIDEFDFPPNNDLTGYAAGSLTGTSADKYALQAALGGPTKWKKLPKQETYCRGCLKQVIEDSIPNMGEYFCKIDLSSGFFDCYVSTDNTEVFNALDTVTGYAVVKSKSYATLATCNKNSNSDSSNNYTEGCAYWCQANNVWLNHGDTSLNAYSNPADTLANCATIDSLVQCACLQGVDPDPEVDTVQRQRHVKCDNGTEYMEYEPLGDSATQEKMLTQIANDTINYNGTKTRYYVNGTTLLLNADNTVQAVIVQPPYLFSNSTIIISTDANWQTTFDTYLPAGAETRSNYQKIQKFDNGTIWWFKNPISNSATELQKSQYIQWFETNSTSKTTRTCYYLNGTVTVEEWVWDATNSVYTVSLTTVLVAPLTIFVPYEDRSNSYVGPPSDPDIATMPSGYVKRIYNLPPTNSSIFFYAPDPTKLPNESGTLVGETKMMRINTDPYYYEKYRNTTDTGFQKDFRMYQFRNGSQAWYELRQGAAFWSLYSWISAPEFFYHYVKEDFSFYKNISTDSTHWNLAGSATTFSLEGYELESYSNQTVYRYIPDLPLAPFNNDMSSFDYQKMLAITYNRTERYTDGRIKVFYRNGSVALFNQSVALGRFLSYVVPPKSYFTWHASTTYIDDSVEFVYSNFTTMLVGQPIPNTPELSRPTNFEYNRVSNVGLLYSMEFRQNGTKFAYFRNGSIARYENNKFTSWTKAPAKFWVWCDVAPKGQYADFVDNVCTNGTTIRVADALPQVLNTVELQLKNATGFYYMEIFNNGTTKTFYRNGTVALFNNQGFQKYLVAPKSIYVWVTSETINDDGSKTQILSNGTIRQKRPVDTQDTSALTIATSYDIIDIYPNSSSRIWFRNGSVASINSTGSLTWIIKPSSYYLSWTTENMEDGSFFKYYSNGTTYFKNRKLEDSDTELYNRTSIDFYFKNESLSGALTISMMVYYRNGTIAQFDIKGFVKYIKAPESYFYALYDGSTEYQYLSRTETLHYNVPLPDDASNEEKALSYLYYQHFGNQTRRYVYRNGTIAWFSFNQTTNDIKLVSYEVPPKYFFANYEENNRDDGKTEHIFENQTIRVIYPEMTDQNTRYENATGINFIDNYPNGTAVTNYLNGTKAVYYKGIFLRYDVAPSSYYIDYPRTDYDDGSYELWFLNGTRRFIARPLSSTNTALQNSSALLYSDCQPNGECYFYYRNGTITLWVGGIFKKTTIGPKLTQVPQEGMYLDSTTTTPDTPIPTPTPVLVIPSTPPDTPVYAYVNKTGPKHQVYDKSQGGIKKYKEQDQSDDSRATKSSSTEPLCKWRNQIIIMADRRVSETVYSGRRRMQTMLTSDDTPVSLAMKVETVTFLPESFSKTLQSLSFCLVFLLIVSAL